MKPNLMFGFISVLALGACSDVLTRDTSTSTHLEEGFRDVRFTSQGDVESATVLINGDRFTVQQSGGLSGNSVLIEGAEIEGSGFAISQNTFLGSINNGYLVFLLGGEVHAISLFQTTLPLADIPTGSWTATNVPYRYEVLSPDDHNVITASNGTIQSNTSTGSWTAQFGDVFLSGSINTASEPGLVSGTATLGNARGEFGGLDTGDVTLGSFSGSDNDDLVFGGVWQNF